MRTHVSFLCWGTTTWGQYNNEDACVGVGGRPHGVNTTMRTHVSLGVGGRPHGVNTTMSTHVSLGVGGRPHGVNTTMRTHVSVLGDDHMGSIQQ